MKLFLNISLLLALTRQVFATGSANTGVTWQLPSGQFTAFSFTLQIPRSIPWSTSGSSVVFNPQLLNTDNSAWYYFDSITYNNNTGTSDVPPYFVLDFEALISSKKRTLAGVNLYPADTITLAYSQSGAVWTQTWNVVRGSTGTAAGATASTGSFAVTFPSDATFNVVNLQVVFNQAFFDFGPITWSNIHLTASTTSTAWCPPTPGILFTPAYNFTYPSGFTTATSSGGTSTCSLPVMTWLDPPDVLVAEQNFIAKIEACKKIIAAGGHCHY